MSLFNRNANMDLSMLDTVNCRSHYDVTETKDNNNRNYKKFR